jgi:hypothetical protein
MDQPKSKGGRHMMVTAVKPIRQTEINFSSKKEMEQFIKYATSTEKTRSPEMERLRDAMKNHKRTQKRRVETFLKEEALHLHKLKTAITR